jgi:Arc/MetJ family transcription regulator
MYDRHMKKRTSLNLDLDLVAEAREVLGTNGTTETVHRALEEVVRTELLRRLAEETFEDLTPEALAELRRWRTADGVD